VAEIKFVLRGVKKKKKGCVLREGGENIKEKERGRELSRGSLVTKHF